MNSKGFFGLLILLGALELLLTINTGNAEIHSKIEQTELLALEMQESAFKRTEAEIYIDKKIEQALTPLPLEKPEAEIIKARANITILEAFKKLNLSAKLCSKNNSAKELNFEKLSEISKVSVITLGSVQEIEYVITGGEDKKFYPCAEIEAKNFSTEIRIPTGYTSTQVRLIP
ncbi:MAG TPA: hypothetical protein VFF13_02230 [archaeon]|nr:hypothetical protein [archaeon]